MSSTFDEMTLEGWLLLENSAVVLDFHAQHRRAGRTIIPYSVIERAEVVPIMQPGRLFRSTRVSTVIRLVRFDRDGFANDASRDTNKMFIPNDSESKFSAICQEIMERAASSLSPTANNQTKMMTGMFTATSDGKLEPRGAADSKLEAINGVAGITLGATTIARETEIHSLRKVHARVITHTTEAQSEYRTTATRVIAGATIAGRTGAVVGSIAKKRVPGQKFRIVRIQITGPEFHWDEEIQSSDETKARIFASKINGRSSN